MSDRDTRAIEEGMRHLEKRRKEVEVQQRMRYRKDTYNMSYVNGADAEGRREGRPCITCVVGRIRMYIIKGGVARGGMVEARASPCVVVE